MRFCERSTNRSPSIRNLQMLSSRLVLFVVSTSLVTAGFASGRPDIENENREAGQAHFKFSFGEQRHGFVPISPKTLYTPANGYGFIPPANLQTQRDTVCGDGEPFLFAVNVPEGNYDVTLKIGNHESASLITVKAEARRLLLQQLRIPAGKFITRQFTVNVRYPELSDGQHVQLKKDEENDFDWDHRLTLEFDGRDACLATLEIQRNDHAVAVYLAGDSTVTDQRREPWAAWGQMLPRFFRAGVAIANHAESGESLKSFIGEKRLSKILETLKADDYLFIQFAHNDQKPGPAHVDAFTSYVEYLRRYIDAARSKGAVPVLVTSMHRRRFDPAGKIVNTLEDYPKAMRQLAADQKVALIDLNAMSQTLFETLGEQGTLKAFVHYPAQTFPGQDQELKDDTHFNSYGAYELARCVVESIRTSNLDLKRYLLDDVGSFDPSKPDPVEHWSLPVSPLWNEQKPSGN